MKMQHAGLPIVLLLVFWSTPSLSQVVVESLVREISAEVAHLTETGQQVDNVVDHEIFNDLGEFQNNVESSLETASSFAAQNTTIHNVEDLFIINGSLNAGTTQPEAGTRRFFRSWSLVTAIFTVESLSTYRFEGLVSGTATAELYILNLDTQEYLFVTLEQGESVFTGQLVENQRYRFDISVYDINHSDLIVDRQEALDFNFEVFLGEPVSEEAYSFEGVKALYR